MVPHIVIGQLPGPAQAAVGGQHLGRAEGGTASTEQADWCRGGPLGQQLACSAARLQDSRAAATVPDTSSSESSGSIGNTAQADLRQVTVRHKGVGGAAHIPVLAPPCRKLHWNCMNHTPASMQEALLAVPAAARSSTPEEKQPASPPCVLTSTWGASGCPTPRSCSAASVMHCGMGAQKLTFQGQGFNCGVRAGHLGSSRPIARQAAVQHPGRRHCISSRRQCSSRPARQLSKPFSAAAPTFK